MEETELSLPNALTDGVMVRPGELEDVLPCSQFSAAYTTNYVWQMQFHENERAIRSYFTRVRLPRAMPVTYPHNSDALIHLIQQAAYLLVAEQNGVQVGFVCGNIEPWRETLSIEALVVAADIRWQGTGKKLWNTALALAQENNCAHVTFSLQTKNDPAITFVQKRGATVCGYNDRLFPNGDIALLFSLSL